ncbi:CPBP family intramembrane glutamic endopeptidase [Nakamurella sp. PAMC28650]|uniref:CPBP family intramembrane glutamic endopeptidase n=1 Tax=Nakamurella sp. PAMC28650 TaxID=2762325 RepID=UPI00164EADA8|nr:type II CAAX endopeptidase family protein [Nakamurella sp. PAMC28650]QNK81418.1 CPBP family intramembrane metalloprotease [Nakamurella sp. PAMC28650]
MNLADTRLGRLVRPTLIDRVNRDHHQSDAAFRRRRIVVAFTTVIGATLLGISLAVRPADPAFYPLTIGLAAVWVAGGLLSGPLHLGWADSPKGMRRPIITPVLIGVAVGVVFVLGALAVREIPPLHRVVDSVLAHARFGSLPLVALVTLLNGIAEEVFFRGAMFAAIGVKRPVLISTLVYGVATIATANYMLVFSALVLGVVLGLERRATGGVLAGILTHVTWSTIMLFVLPPLFA